MISRIFYYWRVLATGFSFAIFGLGGSIVGSAFILLLFPLPFSLQRKYRIMRRIISPSFLFYLWILRSLGLLSSEVKDLERLQHQGQLLVANHPSLLDVVFLISMVKQANCVIKQGLKENKFTLIPTKLAGYVSNASKQMLVDCSESLKHGDSLILFPEGTRSVPGTAVKLLRGAANIAINAQHDITPVFISCSPPTLMKGQKWYEIPESPPHFHLEVLPNIDIAPYLDGPKSKASRKLTRDLEVLYNEKINKFNQLSQKPKMF